MEVKIGIAKITKFGANFCGDAFDLTQRPQGGISAIVADSQGSGELARYISNYAVNRAAKLIAEGARDEAVALGVHEEIYEMKDKKACAFTILSADLADETLVISRNSHCPVLIKTEDYETIYDDSVSPLGLLRGVKPLMYSLPLTPGLIAVAYTNGVANAGKKTLSHEADIKKIQAIIEQNSPEETDYIAHSIVEYALKLDEEKPGGDMTVVVMGVTDKETKPQVVGLNLTYPF
ncbi:MAG: SpoIIE family protein phosphatase [Selenomonadaceae bacterium]|nr:SpoIIE family protein phosphatase [Selenomonadaceae bacterium]